MIENNMFITRVADPKGKEWLVSLGFFRLEKVSVFVNGFIGRLSKKRESQNKKTRWGDVFTYSPIPDSVDDIRLLLLFIVIAIVFTFIGWPLLLVLADLIWFLIVVLGAIMSFVVLRRPITISAKSRENVYYWKVHGLAEARRRKQEVVSALSRGEVVAGSLSSTPSSKSV